ncbi:MAG: lipopolysaccharide export system permease protein [Gammaproteobacteria bacterium]|jgi:lipopolysaccharide export system permease protein
MILQRYFVREILRAFGMIIGALLMIYFSSRFASYLAQAADGKIAADHIFKLISLKMVVSLKDLIPMSLYLGVFTAVIRMQRDSELTAIRAAGGGPTLLISAALKLSAVAAVIVGVVTLYAEPRAELTLVDIRNQTENEATIAGVKAGRFKELSGGTRIFYAETVADDERTLQTTFVQVQNSKNIGLMRAHSAHIETDAKSKDRFAVFMDGISYAGNPGALDYVITRFDRYALRVVDSTPQDVTNNVNYIRTLDLLKFHGPIYSAELQWRLSAAIATLLLPSLAILIGLASRGSNWYLGLITAISVYFVYNNLLGVGKSLIKKGDLPPSIGLWVFHLALIGVAAALIVIQRKPSGLRRRPKQELLGAPRLR